MFTIVRVN